MGFLLPMQFERSGGRWTGKYGRESEKFNRASFVQSKAHLMFMRICEQRLEERQKQKDSALGLKPDEGKWASGLRPQGGITKQRREFGQVPEKNREKFTDPVSRKMKTQNGLQRWNKVQVAVEDKSRLIAARRSDSECSGHAMESSRTTPCSSKYRSPTANPPVQTPIRHFRAFHRNVGNRN